MTVNGITFRTATEFFTGLGKALGSEVSDEKFKYMNNDLKTGFFFYFPNEPKNYRTVDISIYTSRKNFTTSIKLKGELVNSRRDEFLKLTAQYINSLHLKSDVHIKKLARQYNESETIEILTIGGYPWDLDV